MTIPKVGDRAQRADGIASRPLRILSHRLTLSALFGTTALLGMLSNALGSVAIGTNAIATDGGTIDINGGGGLPIAIADTQPCQDDVYASPSPTTSWTPTGTANWFSAGNWSNGVPTSSIDVTEISAGTAQINGAATAGNFVNICYGTLELQSGGSLTAGTIQVGGTLLLSGSMAINGGLLLNGGTLRSTISGTLSTDMSFGNGMPSTISVATGQTLTITSAFQSFYYYQNIIFGSATDNGTIILAPSSFTEVTVDPPEGSIELAGGTVIAGNTALGSFDAAKTTVDAGATLNFNDQQPLGGDVILNLQGAGNVVTGTSSATILQLAQGNFSGAISGAGSLVIEPVCHGPYGYYTTEWCSTGTVVLSGNSTYTGSTTVMSGTLVVNGSIAASSGLTVNAGSRLDGTGTVPSTRILAGATLAPGGGTLHVAGALTIASGAIYAVGVSSTTADDIVVNGAASIGGTVSLSTSSMPAAGTKLTILSASGGVGGKFAPLNIGALGTVAPTLAYDADDVYLDYALITLSPELPTNATTNEKNLAAGIDKAILAGETLPSGIQALGSALPSVLAGSVAQLSGEVGADLPQIGKQTINPFLSVLLDQTDNIDVGLRSNGATGLESGLVAGPPHFGASGTYTPASRAQLGGASPGPIGFWSTGFGGHSSVAGDLSGTGTHSLNANAAGAAVGTDIRIGSDFLMGAAAAGDRSTFATSVGDGSSDDWQFGVYATKRFDTHAYLSLAGAYALQDIKTSRVVTISGTDLLTASLKAHDYGGRVESGYRFAASSWNLTPYVAVQAQRFEAPAYAETASSGSPTYALDYASNNATNAQAELGANIDRTFVLSRNAAFYLYGRAAWSHEFEREASAQATFQSLPDSEFLVQGVQPNADAALLTLEAELTGRNGLSLGLKLNGALSQNATTYFGMAGVDYIGKQRRSD